MRVQDLQIADRPLWQQYISYFANGQYAEAAALLQDAQLANKPMTKDMMNAAFDDVAALESAYYDTVEAPLAQHLAAFNQMVADFVSKQAYSPTAVYATGNFVVYENAVYVYIADVASSGHLPTDTAHWLYLGLRGSVGSDSIDLRLKYAWSSAVQYLTYDAVTYKGVMYYAISDNVNTVPDENPAVWGVLFSLPQAQIYTQADQPAELYDGLIWFDLENL